MQILKVTVLSVLILVFLAGCGQKEYYQAVKEQNITMQIRMENERLLREDKQRQQEKDTLILIEKLSLVTGETENTNDDFMAAMMLLMTQDKNQMADLAYSLTKKNIQLHPIKAPDSIGDTIQKSTSALLGIGAITTGIIQSNNMTEVATTGILHAGTNNTAASGSSVTTGNESPAINTSTTTNTETHTQTDTETTTTEN